MLKGKELIGIASKEVNGIIFIRSYSNEYRPDSNIVFFMFFNLGFIRQEIYARICSWLVRSALLDLHLVHQRTMGRVSCEPVVYRKSYSWNI